MIDLGSQQLIDNIDAHIQQTLAIKDVCCSYELGNVYIMEFGGPQYIERNHLGEPNKYQVVHISPMGMAFLQKLSPTGIPSGQVLVPSEADGLRYLRLGHIADTSWRFVQDPDQLNAIMLQQEYIPMREHNEKLRLKIEINKYNKSILVPTKYYDDKIYAAFLKNLKQGDKFWTSAEKQYIVYAPVKKSKGKWIITTLDFNQQQKELPLSFFAHKRLYKDKPRSFAKEIKK